MSPSGTILYFHTSSGDPVQQTTIAGIRRYCAVRDWAAEAIPVRQSVPSQDRTPCHIPERQNRAPHQVGDDAATPHRDLRRERRDGA
jgi:hypothetical protein